MATRRTKSGRVLRYSEGFTAGLSSAVLEWLLIFLLFVNALFSYLVTKFARYCKLKIPCLLCSRLDHIFGNEKPGFYKDLICNGHKLEISSLAFCRVHDKLADVHGMCEGCLFSFAREKKSSSETYRLLAGKLGIDHELDVHKDTLLKHPMLHSSSEKHCSCCNERCKTKPHPHRLLPRKPTGSEVSNRSPGLVGQRGLKLFDGLKKRRAYMGGHGFDPLSHIGYSELKIASDSESEIPLSDEDDASALTREINNPKEEFVAQRVPPEPDTIGSDTSHKASYEDSTPNKLTSQDSKPAPSIPQEQNDASKPHHLTSSASSIVAGNGSDELNWKPFEKRSHTPVVSDLISLHDVHMLSNNDEAVAEASTRSLDMKGTGDLVGTSKTGTEGALPSSEERQVVEESGEIRDVRQIFPNESGEASTSDSLSITITGPGVERDQASNAPGSALFSLVDLGDAYKLTVGSKGGQAPSMFAEQHIIKDPAKHNEGLKVLLTQTPATRGSDAPVNDSSPRVRGLYEELKIPDGSSSIELDTLQKRIIIERNESGFESLDGSSVSEIEGESLLDRMKRQVEYDRKCMSDLYKELDEERNASAVAANQAMAMITRLQEEKAALHMEALQYLRMMEEQAEYDVEALQKANDLLAEREKEIQDLESELDYYRIKYPEEEDADEYIQDLVNDNVANVRVENFAGSFTVNKSNGSCDLWSTNKSEDNEKTERIDAMPNDNHMSISKDSLLGFEDERLYISQYLKKLENKLNLCSDNGIHTNMCNGVYSGEEHGLNDMEQDHRNLVIQEKNQMDEDESSVQKDSQLSRGGSPAQESTSPSAENPQSVCQENHRFDRPDVSITSKATDLVSIESEVLDLNERLETLEADKDFLEHTINSLQNGNEGVKFIREIAHHLRELRRIGIRRREKDVA